MIYRELIHNIRRETGLSVAEATKALERMVAGISVRLTEDERRHFANQLPAKFKAIALSVTPPPSEPDIIQEFMIYENLEESRAMQHVISAWNALQLTVSQSDLQRIRTRLISQIAGQTR